MAITVSELLNGVASRLVYEGSACDRYPCWNDGKCVLNGTVNFFCECLPAFVGIKCEYKALDICQSSHCRGSQFCDAEGFRVNCSLVNQRDFLSSCLSSRCLNSGVCTNTSGLYQCNCPPLYHGPFCQFDNNDTSYEWSSLEIAIFIFIVSMITLAIVIVCCASSNHMGFYISVPTKHYNRWEEEDEYFDDVTSDNGEQLMAMADIRKGIVVSKTRETVLEELDDSSILQL